MQCPNCNKEAINVNGKYVCLDCGIEISPNEVVPANSAQPTVDPVVAPSIADNNLNPTTTEASTTSPSVGEELPTPVKDEFMKEISTSSPDVSENSFPANATGSVLPDFPDGSVLTEPVTAPEASVNPAQVGEVAQATPIVREPVVIPEEPLAIANHEVESGAISPVGLPESVPVDKSVLENNNSVQEPSLSDFSPVAPIQPEVVMPDTTPAESYFQPSGISITPSQNPTPVGGIPTPEPVVNLNTPTEVPAVESTPVNPSFSEPQVPSVAPEASSLPAEVISQTENNVNPGPGLDDLLASVPVAPQNNVSEPVQDIFNSPASSGGTPFDGLQVGVGAPAPVAPSPQPSQIPSYDNVFGGSPTTPNSPQDAVNPAPKNNKKLFIIIGAVIFAVLVLGGIIATVVSLSNQANQEEITSETDSTALSKEVQDAMEADINATVNYKQEVDFSGLSLSGETESSEESQALTASLIGKKASNAGKWEVDSKGNALLEAKINGEDKKATYIASQKATYEFNATSGAWDKKDGMLIESVPKFYDVDSRAYLFYVAQAEELKDLGKDQLNGTDYNKYQIKPSKEFVKTVITESHASFEEIDFDVTNTDSLLVYAWLDDEKNIVKVSVDGKVSITSEVFSEESTVAIKSEASYEYKDEIEIKAPTASVSSPTASAPIKEADTEVRATVIPVVNNDSEEDQVSNTTTVKNDGRG